MGCCSSIKNFSRRQWLTLFIFSLGNLCKSSGDSLMGPLYTPLAAEKGAHSSIYGSVLGIYNLTVMVVSLVLGRYLEVIGSKFVFGAGMFIMGVTNIIFGFLMYEEVKWTFMILSFAVRITTAIGASGFSTTRNCLIASEFKDNTGTVFSIVEFFMGLGLTLGPIIGTVLLEAGGFVLPFATIGGIQILVTVIVIVLLPGDEIREERNGEKVGFLKTLKVPSIVLYLFTVITAAASIGFLDVGLVEHLEEHGTSKMIIAVMFMSRGLSFALSSPIFGVLCDKVWPPSCVLLLSSVMLMIGFLLIGPAPFLPLSTSSFLNVVSLLIMGAGVGGELTGAYTGTIQAALNAGFPDSLSTYGELSGLFSASLYFGWFIGPSLGGYIIRKIGFAWASIVMLALHGLVSIFYLICIGAKCSWRRPDNPEEYVTLKPFRLLKQDQVYDSIEDY